MNIEQARFNMVEQQIRPWEVLDQSVLDLLFTVKREEFVPAACKALAFADLELPLGQGQVMLAPRIEARLLQELGVKPTDKVLEIGTGSGYMAALLAARAEHVVSLEINAELADVARGNLARAGITNVTVETVDGSAGFPARGPYDVIMISGGIPAVPEAILRQLRQGGRLAAIVGTAPVMRAQLITCTGEGVFSTVNLFETVAPALENFAAPTTFSF
ncbi:protein-L-isoaspartate O-methyltransferase [Azovibrio restrictus]|jgi:protein-L-isoaspartate(D-aspartate) O-methyltransferase|uniref:protein-L-isoaspartate O-methyltransferase family protein n=1 Tax=Azovibrio restrictus TaxID=146938 RepID=UPI0026F2E8BC|nr:protein-L-isoaspartate O-methyltransferase [Azovibrio restrictus]